MKNNIQQLVRNHILKMSAYSAARTEYTGNDAIFLDANENPIGSVCSEIHNRYPDPMQIAIKKQLALLEKVSENQIFIGNGSDECIDVFVRVFCEPKAESILTCPPVFSMYEHVAHIQDVAIKEILLTELFQLNVDVILEEIKKDTSIKIIFICTPNNPTGNNINPNDIEKILTQFNGLVVIDEAYQDFSSAESWTNRLNEFNNLVVIKTLSKAYGMADVRIGMLFANEEIIHYLNVIKMPYNVNTHSQKLALEALNNIQQKNAFVQTLNESKKWLISEIETIAYIQHIYPSDANFFLIKVADANDLYQYLIRHKIIVRNRNNAPLLKGCLRISVGTNDENKRLIEVLKMYKSN